MYYEYLRNLLKHYISIQLRIIGDSEVITKFLSYKRVPMGKKVSDEASVDLHLFLVVLLNSSQLLKGPLILE